MSKTYISGIIITVGLIVTGASAAADEATREQLKNELTASIPAGGVHALHEIRQSLAAELPDGLPLRAQMQQLRAAFGAAAKSKESDRI